MDLVYHYGPDQLQYISYIQILIKSPARVAPIWPDSEVIMRKTKLLIIENISI